MDLMLINHEDLIQNDFSCKTFDEIKFNQLKQSISKIGLLKPLEIRMTEAGEYEIIDGRFRLKALLELGIAQSNAIYRGDISRDSAIELYLWLNDFSFNIDHVKLVSRIGELQKKLNNKELEKIIPYTREELNIYESLLKFDWSMYDDQEKKQCSLF